MRCDRFSSHPDLYVPGKQRAAPGRRCEQDDDLSPREGKPHELLEAAYGMFQEVHGAIESRTGPDDGQLRLSPQGQIDCPHFHGVTFGVQELVQDVRVVK